MNAIQHGYELSKLIEERGEEPKQVSHGSAGGDGFTLFRFADGTEVIETNAGLVTEDADGFASLRHCCGDEIDLLTYAEAQIVRLSLGDTPTNCHGVAAYEHVDGVRLSDGVGLDVVCKTTDEVDSELEEMAAFYAENK